MSEKHLKAKIASLKLTSKKKNAETRKLRRQCKALESKCLRHKGKASLFQQGLPKYGRGEVVKNRFPVTTGIKRHKYGLRMVSLCVALYALANCSFRGVVRILYYFQLELGIQTSELPSKSSVENWVQKIGCHVYSQYDSTLYESDYCLILDESMVIGQERMMVALGMPAMKEGQDAARLQDVRILAIEVKPSWKSGDVKKLIEKVADKMGKKPVYGITDGGTNLKKGLEEAGLLRICDVGHEVSKLVEQTYKYNSEFGAFMKAVAGVKFREVMKGQAYLLPPKQRSIARFMNFSSIVNWARKMLGAMPKFSAEEQRVFGWMSQYKTLIAELGCVYDMTESILKILKNQGISFQNIDRCLEICKKQARNLPNVLIEKIKKYLGEEKAKLPDGQTVWNDSSDVLESLFGKYKYRNATNPLHGVTLLVLSLCIYTHFDKDIDQMQPEIKQALEGVSMTDLGLWKMANLFDNQVVRRNKMLKK